MQSPMNTSVASKRAQRLKDIEHVFTEYGRWVKDSLEVQSVPFVQVLAGVTGAGR